MSSIPPPRVRECTPKSAPQRGLEYRRAYENLPSIIMSKDSSYRVMYPPNADIKSKYCSSELKKLEHEKRLGRNDSAPPTKMDSKTSVPSSNVGEFLQKDVIFLRKMLAMNKKQEMLLNKRLARLMEEEEAQNLTEEKEKNNRGMEQPTSIPKITPRLKANKNFMNLATIKNDNGVSKLSIGNPSSEARRVEQKSLPKLVSAREVQDCSALKMTQVKKIQYDINGRRIYRYSDIENSQEVETERQPEPNNSLAKREEKSSQVNKRGSASSKRTFTLKKSLTYITTPSRTLKKPLTKERKRKVRKEDGDSPSYANSENPLNVERRPTKAGCKGDGVEVENVVVHCTNVARNNATPKKNVKVWNYESLHSLKSENSLERNKMISSEQRLRDGGERNKNTPDKQISVRNNGVQFKLKNPIQRKDERGLTINTVETMFSEHKKINDVKNLKNN